PPPVHRLYSTDRDAWIEAAEDCLNLPFGSWPLLKCILVKNAGGWDDLVVSAMHAVIDVASGTRFLNELLETYDALQRGEVVPADQSFPFPERAERLFPRPYRGIRSLGNVASFLSRQIREEIFYRRKREKGSRLLPQESVR
ncbi:MAG: hypothetical protein JSU96_01335, partial [Acidobacteriota bacterium]